MILSVHQPQYIPWLGFFDKIAKSSAFVFLDKAQYKGGEFQNRNKIRTKAGWSWLTVPVVSKGRGRQSIDSCLIDNSFPWRRQHLKAIKSWYAKAAFFKGHIGFLEDFYSRDWERLVDLNLRLIDYALKELAISTPVYYESALNITAAKTKRIIELCKVLNADTYLSGVGAKAYLEEGLFAQAGIKLAYQDFTHPVYQQQFISTQAPFQPFMSVLDLLLNEGEKAKEILFTAQKQKGMPK